MEMVLDFIFLVIIMSWFAMLGYVVIKLINPTYSERKISTSKDTKNKNNVHFYVARDKGSNMLWLYLGKPTKCNYTGRVQYGCWSGSKSSEPICMEYSFEEVGLDKNDYKDLKWEDEPVEVFLNLED